MTPFWLANSYLSPTDTAATGLKNQHTNQSPTHIQANECVGHINLNTHFRVFAKRIVAVASVMAASLSLRMAHSDSRRTDSRTLRAILTECVNTRFWFLSDKNTRHFSGKSTYVYNLSPWLIFIIECSLLSKRCYQGKFLYLRVFSMRYGVRLKEEFSIECHRFYKREARTQLSIVNLSPYDTSMLIDCESSY